MLFKIIGALLIIGGACTVGISADIRLRRRIECLNAWVSALSIINAEVTCRLSTLPEIMRLLSKRGDILSTFFSSCADGLSAYDRETFIYIWTRALRASVSITGLLPQDVEILSQVGMTLGRYDSEQQSSELISAQGRLLLAAGEAVREREKKGKIYKALGLTGGIGIVLIFI